VQSMKVLGPRLAQIYGQGESPMTITALSKSLHANPLRPRWREIMSSVGVPRTDVDVRVVDAEDRELPVGEIGEVVCRGDVVMAGYWQNPQATRDTLRGGWLHTGDMGCFDAEGFLTLKDRSKDLIISGGANIYPREVEEVLLRHPAVLEVSVIGRQHAEWGEEVVACVVTHQGRTVTETELDSLCLSAIARFKRPRAYVFLDTLPKNNYGKVLKTELRKRYDGPAPAPTK
jgi:acyl-CoA synthetase (AMP-forming)/AMP-acid ligase II